MRKNNVLFGVFGLIVGLVIGFIFANSVNKTGFERASASPNSSVAPVNPAIPPDHPPLDGQTGNASATAPLPQVMESIEKAKQQPGNYEAQMTAADLYYQIQRFDDAAKYYETAVKLKPAETEPLIKSGNAYFDAASAAAETSDTETANVKFAQAEKWYLLALAKEPKNINVRTDLGLTFFLRTPRDVNRAIKEYKVSLGIDPTHEVTLQNLTLAYSENGDKQNLQATLEMLKKVNPGNKVIARLEGPL